MDEIKKPQPITVTIDGKQYKMELRVANVGKLRDAFGTVGAADAELARVLIAKDEDGKTEAQKFSADFIAVVTKYLDCVLIDAPEQVFLTADISELGNISEGIAQLIHRYMPKPAPADPALETTPKKKTDPM